MPDHTGRDVELVQRTQANEGVVAVDALVQRKVDPVGRVTWKSGAINENEEECLQVGLELCIRVDGGAVDLELLLSALVGVHLVAQGQGLVLLGQDGEELVFFAEEASLIEFDEVGFEVVSILAHLIVGVGDERNQSHRGDVDLQLEVLVAINIIGFAEHLSIHICDYLMHVIRLELHSTSTVVLLSISNYREFRGEGGINRKRIIFL